MKNVLMVLALMGAAGSAMAYDVPASQVRGVSLDQLVGGGSYDARVAPVYSGIPGPYSAFAAATGAAGFDDYTSTVTGGAFTIASLRFVGGVAQANGTMRINFYNPDATLATFANITLPSAGDFIWTITFGTLPDGSDSAFVVPSAGFMEMVVGAGFTGRWFFTTTAPTVGSNNIAVGTGSTLNPQRRSAFELNAVPSPASLALLGVGGLMVTRRRRA
ncbi:MAG TPA: hypothetical protein VD997_01380 [Phycisphaerales bacterium]|nr:hypothetical protein [Phycisphaerales bacterium]